jgi:nitric oxide reductase activation protein
MTAHGSKRRHAALGAIAALAISAATSLTAWADTEVRVIATGVAARERPIDADAGVPVARYFEWDYVLGRKHADWTTIVEFEPRRASTVGLDRLLSEYADVENRIRKLIRSTRVARPMRIRRRPEGERLDLDSCIRAAIEYRGGITPDPRVYETSEMRDRDLAVLVLLDASESTKEFVRNTTTTVLSVERAATALLAHAMEGLGALAAIRAYRESWGLYRDRRPDLYKSVLTLDGDAR